MKQLLAVAVVVAAVSLMAEPGTANAAQASLSGGIGAGSYRPWAEAIQEVNHKKKKHKHHKHKHRNHEYHKQNNGGFFLFFGSQAPKVYHEQQQRRDCHGVVTDGYFQGRYAKLGGTMCYNHAGNGYIVRGSRYLIHYY